MACHEISALRLGLFEILGNTDESERAHELAELGDAIHEAGPIRAMVGATDLFGLKRSFADALAHLEERVAKGAATDRELGYLRTLLVLTKKVELELGHCIDGLVHLSRDLEEMHDFVHEVHPAE